MRISTLALVLATAVGLCLGSNARASLPLNFGDINGSQILFTPVASPAGANITFTPGSGTGGYGFQVSNTGDASLVGAIGGTFNYLTSAIVTTGGLQTVGVTGLGSLTINDNGGSGGSNLTATIHGFDASFTFGSAGELNYNDRLNLSNLSYSGTNADLLALVAGAANGIMTISFQFTSTESLTSLAANGGTTSYSGSINTVPEPSSMAIAALGALGLIGYGLRRRKALGA